MIDVCTRSHLRPTRHEKGILCPRASPLFSVFAAASSPPSRIGAEVVDSAPTSVLAVFSNHSNVHPEANFMLEQMRKSSQSLLIYALFGIIIAVFIISFGPQSRGGGCEGSMGGDESAARVGGETVSTQAYTYAFRLMGGGNQPAQFLRLRRFKEAVMDRLIERELLANEAERLGIDVGEEDVNKMLVEAKIVGLGIPRSVPRIQKDGVFNYDQFKNFALYDLGLSPERFIQQQRRELLASEVRDFMRASVRVSPEEIKTAFEAKNRQVNLEYVRFPSRKYEGEAEPTADEIASYIKANEAKLKETFDQRKAIYADVPQEARLRELVLHPKPPKPAAPAIDARAEETGLFSRRGSIVEQIGDSP